MPISKQSPVKNICLDPMTVRSGDLEVTGCMRKINSVDDIPREERGILESIAKNLNLGDQMERVAAAATRAPRPTECSTSPTATWPAGP